MKPETDVVASVIKMAKNGTFPTYGNLYGPSGYAPYHDLASKVPAAVDTEMQALLKGILDGSITTNVSATKPAQ
jgi:basic membrane protein A and related proteins